jgi:hypothetical protein
MNKEFTIKELTKRGCIRDKGEDFRDDGHKFKICYYKGLRISYLKAYERYYISIRIPEHGDYIFEDYKDKEWYKLADEFNGYDSTPDGDKIIENCEAIIKGIKELQDEIAKEEKPDLELFYMVKAQEIEMAEKVLNDFKSGQYIWKIKEEYRIKYVIQAVKGLEEEIYRVRNREFTDLSLKELRRLRQQLNEFSYLYIRENDYYIKMLKEYMKEDI